ncbi:mitochondrial ribosome biogenesis GTP-binding protein YlqF [Andalucia godoyi]|uniref:Mitochondrial ribosome biogenesis GTP-binding protein YlqF n=1 Tax=Andalucia godoyi TaxID=505711 RepID=A0A8K0AH71_ANDGO|nr:mitochondrial ribosome biogenesis GTP-binding protein YlqF [Andalucia godoyi]|eukprot:ANDGO_02651.mRNA.1 mitochondrial ribosome biogenesis GTP-binding protein YlqF
MAEQRLDLLLRSIRGQLSWYPGHMVSAQRAMHSRISGCDLVLEVRDARAPFSSSNPQLEPLVNRRKRIIVLNKTDLISLSDQEKLKKIFAREPLRFGNATTQITFTSSIESVRMQTQTRNEISRLVKLMQSSVPEREFKTSPMLALVAGVPNCGKSTLINALRVKHMPTERATAAAKTGAKAGVTRQVSAFSISESPPIRVFDSPGIFMPTFADSDQDAMRAFCLSATGCVNDERFDPVLIAEFILWQLLDRRVGDTAACAAFAGVDQLPRNIHDVLEACVRRYGIKNDVSFETPLDRDPVLASVSGNELLTFSAQSINAAARLFIRAYRAGKFGKFCLDDLDKPPCLSALRVHLSRGEDGLD